MDIPKYFQEKNPLNSIFMPSSGKYMIHLPFITICNAKQMLFYSSEFYLMKELQLIFEIYFTD